MLTPDDLSLAESLLRSKQVDPEALQKHMASINHSGKKLKDVLVEAGVIKGSGPGADASMAPTRAPKTASPVGPGRRFGKYEIVDEIARGGMGVVYRAHEPGLNRKVALKVLLAGEGAGEEQVQRFLREARSAAGLRHPNIIQVYDVGQAEGIHYFAMELVEGTSLDRVLQQEGPLQPRRALRIAMEAARALQHAHAGGIIHRDVKPGNILLAALSSENSLARSMDGETRPERVLLSDFGLAKDLGTGSSLTLSGNLIGTPAYMSPEQAAGRVSQIDARSDVYSIGAVLYEALTGHTPFPGETLANVLSDIRSLDATSLRKLRPEIHRDIELIVQKAMSKEPGRRYASAGELADDIERYLDGEAVQAAPPTMWYRVTRYVRKRRAAVLSAGVIAVAVSTLGGWLGWREVEDRRQKREAATREGVERRDRALAHVALAKDLITRKKFDEALIEAGLAETILVGLPEAREVATQCRLSRLVAKAEELTLGKNWKGAREVLNAASEFRDHPDIRRLARICDGTGTLEVTAAEAGLEVDVAPQDRGVHWEVEAFPPIEDARRAGFCLRLGATPLQRCDLPMGGHLVVLSRGGKAVRLISIELGRSQDLRLDHRVFRVGRSVKATHESPAKATEEAGAGGTIEMEEGTHSLVGVAWKSGLRFRAVEGAKVLISAPPEGPVINAASHGLELENLDFETDSDGIQVMGSSRVRMVGCRIFGSRRGGISLERCPDWMVRDVEIGTTGLHGLRANESPGGLAWRVTVRGAGQDAIEVMGDESRILRCVADGAGGAGLAIQGARCSIRESRAVNCGQWGIHGGGLELEIVDSLVVNCSISPKGRVAALVRAVGSERLVIEHNTILGGSSKDTGLVVHQSTGRIYGNLIAGAKRGFHYHGGEENMSNPSESALIDWLLIWNCQGYGRAFEDEIPTLAEARTMDRVNGKRGFRILEHSLDADPKFVDADTGDYRLKPDSPARAAAHDGSDIGARLETIAADNPGPVEASRRDIGRVLAAATRTSLRLSNLADARRRFHVLELVAPDHPDLPALREQLK